MCIFIRGFRISIRVSGIRGFGFGDGFPPESVLGARRLHPIRTRPVAILTVVDLRFLCPKSPKWNPLTLLSLPMPSDLRMVAGAAAGSSSSALAMASWSRGRGEEHDLLRSVPLLPCGHEWV